MTSPTRPRLRLVAGGTALSCVALLGLAGCGEDPEVDEPTSQSPGASPSESVSESPSASPSESVSGAPGEKPIQVVIEAGTISPMGERIQVSVGEPIQVIVTSDVEGSLHVHSTPEQEIDFTEGTTEHEITLQQPGVVEVESHDPDLVVLQLEAR